MDSDDRFLALVHRLYAAPGSEQAWRTFLLDLCKTLNGICISFISHDLSAQKASVALTAQAEPEAVEAYLQHWAAMDPWAYSAGARRLTSGSVVLGEQLIGRLDFTRHYDLAQCIVAVIEQSDRALSEFSINGGERRRPFDDDDVAVLHALMPHLKRVLQLHRRIVSAEGLAARSVAVLDQLAHGVLMFDTSARAVLVNRAAETMLKAHDGLALDRGELRAARSADCKRLREIIGAVIEASRNSGAHSGGTVLIARPSGGQPWRVVVAPLTTRWIDQTPEAAAAVAFVSDPEQVPRADTESLRALFGLSGSEARVAAGLIDGESLDRVAKRLYISRNTVRTHLARLFSKTRTNRQAELVRVLLTALPLRTASL